MSRAKRLRDRYPLIEYKKLEPLMFFVKKHHYRPHWGYEDLKELSGDLFKVSERIVNIPEIAAIAKKLNDMIPTRGVDYENGICEYSYLDVLEITSINRFTKTLETVNDFYELRSNAGEGAVDQRYDLFRTLRASILKMITFLVNRSDKYCKAHKK